MGVVRRTAVLLTLAIALIVATLAAGAWEMRRLDHSVQALRTDFRTDARLDRTLKSLAALSRETVKLRESGLRQEFYFPLYAYETQVAVAVQTGYSDCGAAKQTWQSYVNDKLIPFLNDPDNRAMKMAVRRDDPDYHDTLLNALSLSC